jgi:hypothetical protein
VKVDLTNWPEVPAGEPRPRQLYVNETITDRELLDNLQGKGWRLVDVRLLPSADSLRGTLEGIRLGSIEPDVRALKFLELDARVLGLLHRDAVAQEQEKKVWDEDSLESILGEMDSLKAPMEAFQVPEVKKNKGRPKGSKDKVKRKHYPYEDAAAEVRKALENG